MKLTLFVTLSLFAASFAQAQMTDRGVIESPSPYVSGIGFISGWKCNTNDIELWLTGSAREGVLKLKPAQNMPRSDTAGVCLGEENNGFIIQVNWNDLIGYDKVVARDNGEAFDSADFAIGHTGLPFIRDKGGTEIEVVDFPSPDTATTLTWSTATQHFEVSGTEDIAPCTGDACEGSGAGTVICEGNSEERIITCEYRESVPPAVDSFLDGDGCFRTWAQPQHPGTNWYLVREWAIVYGLFTTGEWHRGDKLTDGYIAPSIYVRPVADDIPGTWNRQRYREIPFNDQASYHLQQNPSRGQGIPNSYTQFQFYALGPLSAYEEGKPCFREIPQAPAP